MAGTLVLTGVRLGYTLFPHHMAEQDLGCMQWLMGVTDVGVAAHSCFYLVPRGWSAIQKNLEVLCDTQRRSD